MKIKILLLLAVFLLTACVHETQKNTAIEQANSISFEEKKKIIIDEIDYIIYFDFETSLQGCKKYVGLGLNDATTFTALKMISEIYFRKKEYLKSLDILNNILNKKDLDFFRNVYSYDLHRQYSIVYKALGDTLKSSESIKKILYSGKRRRKWLVSLVVLQKFCRMVDKEQYDKDMKEIYRKELFEKNVRSKYYGGIINYLDGNYEKSLYYFENLDYFRGDASAVFKVPAYLFKAMFLLRLNKTEEAKENYLQALKYKKEHESVRNITVPIEEYIGHIDYVVATPKMLEDIKKLKKLVANQ